MKRHLSRRTLLRGIGLGSGVCIGLPILDAMLDGNGNLIGRAKGQASGATNFLTFFIPNGVFTDTFWPDQTGANYELSRCLMPLSEFKSDFTLVQGLEKQEAFRNQDINNDAHVRGHASYATGGSLASNLTCEFASVDQVAAAQIGTGMRFKSLPVALGGALGEVSDNISWETGNTPVQATRDPALLFEKLFGKPAGGGLSVDYRTSVLDYVADDITKVKMEIPFTDKARLDEYLTSVRDLETQLAPVATLGPDCVAPAVPDARIGGEPPAIDDNDGTYSNERAQLLLRLQVLAFSCGFTRVGSFMLASRGNKRQFKWLGAVHGEDGHHGISHETTPEGREAQSKIVTDEMEQFAYMLRLMKGIPQGGQNLLYNSLIFFANECGQGDSHDFSNIPVILAGQAGGKVQHGRHIRYNEGTPYDNMLLTVLRVLGLSNPTFGVYGKQTLSDFV
ncbi:MAG: DUF1552 domain-containing protein [Polyangiaceae bacterium]|nr:DUF1552 domain-containing protein [Polyangiaceae bacterium]